MEIRKSDLTDLLNSAYEPFLSVPGEAGRKLVQRYFEAEHSATAVIRPITNLRGVTRNRRNGRATTQSASKSKRRGPQRFPPHPTGPARSLWLAYGFSYGQTGPVYPPHSGYTLSNKSAPPAPLFHGNVYYGNVVNSWGRPSTNPMYRRDSFPVRY